MAAAALEQALESALLTKFVPLTPDDERYTFSVEGAPLAGLDAKIRLGFALGLFGKLAKADLALIRQVRNTFAHSRLKIGFETPEISAACMLLRLPERVSALADTVRASASSTASGLPSPAAHLAGDAVR